MIFEKQLHADATAAERFLADLLSEGRLSDSAVPPRLAAAMRHAVLGGGKRFRPFVVMASARLFAAPPRPAIAAAAAVELIHCYSLVHDDLPAMDNDLLRRGQPTVWSAFDDWTAILAGDALQSLAFEVLSAPDLELDGSRQAALIHCLARGAGPAGMVAGQQLDLDVGRRGEPADPSLAFVERMQSLKTGALLACAAECGAILGNADPSATQALCRYGHAIGQAFQIADDLLDVEGSEAETGKAVSKDSEAGKATFIGLLGTDGARQSLVRLKAEALGALAGFGENADALRGAVEFIASRRS